MVQYIIQTIAFQILFLIIYDVFLKKETFFNWNRTYLLATSILSLVIPLIKVQFFRNVIPNDFLVALPSINIGGASSQQLVDETLNAASQVDLSIWSWTNIAYLGMILAFILLITKIAKLVYLIYSNPKEKRGTTLIITLVKSNAAFSFFHCIFLGEQINKEQEESILKHELVHVKQKHSLDLLLFEILRVVMWFNPLVYMYQIRIANLHEYIADANAVKLTCKNLYYEKLLAQVFQVKHISIVNPFFKESLIKKRIVMLQKSKSNKLKLVRYLMLVPIIVGMLIYSSCIQEKEVDQKKENIQITTTFNKAVEEIFDQVQKQGYTNDDEQYGFSLLLNAIQSDNINPELIVQVNKLIEKKNKTDLENKIAQALSVMQEQGNLSNEELKELKSLLLLTTEDGFNNPFFNDVVEFAEIPFGVIENPPIYPNCENEENQKNCFVQNVSKLVSENFNADIGNNLKLEGPQRINVIFIVDSDGSITGVKARAPHKILEEEAIRVVNLLPKMTPGNVKGKNVKVPYSLPIVFKIEDDKGQ